MRQNKAPPRLLPLFHIIWHCASLLISLNWVISFLNTLIHISNNSYLLIDLLKLNYQIKEDILVFLLRAQIFMCLLWVLLQFVILAVYWDAPSIGSEGGAVTMEMKQEEGDEEEVLLMGSDEEPVHTYRAVSSNQKETFTSCEMQPVRGASEISNPFKNFSASRGEWAGLTVCPKQWLSVFLWPICWVQVGRCVTANAHVSYLLYWFSCVHIHTDTIISTHSFPFPMSLWAGLHGMSDQIPGVLIGFVCRCLVYVNVPLCVCVCTDDVRFPDGLVS